MEIHRKKKKEKRKKKKEEGRRKKRKEKKEKSLRKLTFHKDKFVLDLQMQHVQFGEQLDSYHNH
jgi:hypothetical protein